MKKLRVKAILALGVAVVLVIAVVLLALRGQAKGVHFSQKPLLGAMIFAGVIFLGIGVGLLRRARWVEAGEKGPDLDYGFTYRLLAMLAVIVLGFAGARQMAVPDDFGQLGYYRGSAPERERQKTRRHGGEPSCAGAKCHDDKIAEHDRGMHRPVECEVCHGPGARHAALAAKGRPAAEVKGAITKQIKQIGCLVCHRKLAARPSGFPQISVTTHFKYKGVKDETTACWKCHNPHQPLFVDRAAKHSRVHHPISHQCRDCHAQMSPSATVPERHPVIFDCNYCHASTAKAFAARPHKNLECRTCHKFTRTAKYYGYMVRFMAKSHDGRFCLLCHRQTKFRVGDIPPTIDWKVHLTKKAGSLKVACTSCHQNDIHPLPGMPMKVREPPARPSSHAHETYQQCSTACHKVGGGAKALPVSHDGRPVASCTSCHKKIAPEPKPGETDDPQVAGGKRKRRYPPRRPPSHLTYQTCSRSCHRVGGGMKKLLESHRGRTPGTCKACHQPPRKRSGTAMAGMGMTRDPAPLLGPQRPASHAGRLYSRCSICHRVGGGSKPLPSSHVDRTACRSCHAAPPGYMAPPTTAP